MGKRSPSDVKFSLSHSRQMGNGSLQGRQITQSCSGIRVPGRILARCSGRIQITFGLFHSRQMVIRLHQAPVMGRFDYRSVVPNNRMIRQNHPLLALLQLQHLPRECSTLIIRCPQSHSSRHLQIFHLANPFNSIGKAGLRAETTSLFSGYPRDFDIGCRSLHER